MTGASSAGPMTLSSSVLEGLAKAELAMKTRSVQVRAFIALYLYVYLFLFIGIRIFVAGPDFQELIFMLFARWHFMCE